MGLKEEVIAMKAPEWEVAPDGVLVCPCQHRVEDDGECPNGHVSPLLENDLI